MFYPRCSHHLFLPPIPHSRIESLKHDSRKDAKAAKATDRGPLFYDFIRPRQQIRRNRYSNLFRCLQVDKHLKLCGQFGRHVGGFGALQDFIDVHWDSSIHLIEVCPIRNKAASLNRFPATKHTWKPVLCRKLHDLLTMRVGYGIWKDEKSIGFLFDYCIESRANLSGVFYLIILKGCSQASGGALCLPQFALFTCMQWTR